MIAKSFFYLFYFLFIDDFEIHKNTYYVFKVFYFISICLNYAERKKFANVFNLFIKSYNINIKNVIKVFRKFI